jgi:prepilin-type N-terminal cleavage/methylation domain-containing protein
MVNRERTFRRNFTLVEILVVMAILAVLMGMGLGVYSLAMGAAKRSKTEALIKKIEIALETVKSKHGYYFQSNVMPGNKFVIPVNPSALAAGIETTAFPDAEALATFIKTIDYESFKNGHTKEIDISGTPVLVVIDAWERPLFYKCPGTVNTGTFDIISAGSDGLVTNGATSVKLWNDDWTLNGSVNAAFIKAINPKTSDDLANF